MESRIIAIADAYENMVAPHSYRQGMTPQEAVDELMRRIGTHFDPAFVMAFVNTITTGVTV